MTTTEHTPELVVSVDGGDTISIIRNGQQVGTFDRAKLETAWLLRLEHTHPPALAGVLRRDHGFLDSIVYAKAADVLVRAGVTI